MKKAREHLLQDLMTDWLWMHEDQLGTGLVAHHGYMGNVVVWKINDNGSCDYMDFYEFYRETLFAMLAPYKFSAWQSEEYLNIQDAA